MESALLEKKPPLPLEDLPSSLEGLSEERKSIVWKSLHNALVSRRIRRSRFASRLGISYGAVSHWIYGSRFPTRENVQKCAELLAGGDRDAAQVIFAELAQDAPVRLEWDVPPAEERARKLFFL